MPLSEIDPQTGKLHLRFHPGQSRAWRSTARFVGIIAGTRSGKTSFSPWWLYREIKERGPNDYLVCAPSYKLLDKAAVPQLRDALEIKLRLGKVIGGAQGHFAFSPRGEMAMWGARQKKPTRIVFGHADQPDSLEAARYGAAVCDEAGQKLFKRESWEAVLRRLSLDKGRALLPTTPYQLGWLKEEIWDRWNRVEMAKAKGLPYDRFDAEYDCVNFESIENPTFPIDEWERAKASLPGWKFNLFYRGIFSRPLGAVFDCWSSSSMVEHRAMTIPDWWPRYVGIDFGAPNFAAVFLTEECIKKEVEGFPDEIVGTGRLRVYREYRPQESRTAAEHVKYLMRGEPRLPEMCVGGSLSEGQWRAEFAAAGYPIAEPDQKEVEVMLDRVYAQIASNGLLVHESCKKLIWELENFSREVDDAGNVTNELDDEPSHHGVASLRYIVGWLRRVGAEVDVFF